MLKQFLILVLLFNLFNFLHAQKLNKKLIANSKWYINNQDSSFFKKDTLNIILIKEIN